MTRVLLIAGKGGVGKSTVAGATGALAAARGRRTLVMSIDSAHNLSDLLDVRLGHHATPVADRLFGLEVDLNRELSENWSAVTDFLRTMTAGDPRVTQLVAEECAVLPGMEEVFGLMRLQTVVETGEFDLVVVDSPPTADFLKFLRLPDVLSWFMGKYRPFDRALIQRLRPVAEAMHWPVPDDAALREVEQWYARVAEANRLLMDHHRVSARLVMNPDHVGLAETRRALTWTSLFGMNVDAVIVNRVLPQRSYPAPLGGWVERQQAVLAETAETFAGMTLLQGEMRGAEVSGVGELERLGDAIYGGRQPWECWSDEPPVRWNECRDEAELALRLPFLKKDAFRLLAHEDGLVLHVGGQRRVFPLPPAVLRRRMLGAGYEGGWLRVRFGAAGE